MWDPLGASFLKVELISKDSLSGPGNSLQSGVWYLMCLEWRWKGLAVRLP